MTMGRADLEVLVRARDEATRTLNTMSASVQANAAQWRQAGLVMTAAGAAITGALGYATKAAADFDMSMRSTNVMMRLNEAEFRTFSDEVLEMADTLGVSASKSSESLYQIVSAGYRGADAIDILTVAMKGAVGGQAEAATTTAALTKAMNIFGLEGAEGAARAMDVFFGVVDTGLLSFEQMAQAFPRAAAMAAGLGVSIEEVGASLGALTKVSASTEEAATSLNATFAQLVNPSAALEELYENWGVKSGPEAIRKFNGLAGVLRELMVATGGEVTALNELFPNIRAIRAVLPLVTTNSEDLASAMDTVQNSTGRATEAFEQMEQSGGRALEKAQERLKTIGIEIGQELLPIVADYADQISEVLQGTADWMEANPELAESLLKAAGGAGVLMLGLGPLLMALPGLTTLFGGLTTAVGGLGAALGGGALLGLGSLTAIISGLGVGIGAIVWAVNELQNNAAKRTYMEAWKTAGDDVQAYAQALREAEHAGVILTEAERRALDQIEALTEAEEHYQRVVAWRAAGGEPGAGKEIPYRESLKALQDVGVELSDEQQRFITLSEAAEAFNNEMAKGTAGSATVLRENADIILEMGGYISYATMQWVRQRERVEEVAAAVEKTRQRLMDLQAQGEAVSSSTGTAMTAAGIMKYGPQHVVTQEEREAMGWQPGWTPQQLAEGWRGLYGRSFEGYVQRHFGEGMYQYPEYNPEGYPYRNPAHQYYPEFYPEYQRGTRYVPETGPAILHKGEQVVPAGHSGHQSDTRPLEITTNLVVDGEILATSVSKRQGVNSINRARMGKGAG